MAKYIPTHQSTLETYLEWRFAQQRLAKPSEPDAVRLLVSCGWLEPKALGAELELIPKEKGMVGAIERCRELAATIPDAFVPQQFDNPSNPDTHAATTGP